MGFHSSIDAILALLRRRKWLAVSIFSVLLTTLVTAVASLPPVYRSSTVIAIERQQVPENYVQSMVTLGVVGRLRVLNQRILSRERLNQLATQLDLYPELRGQQGVADAVAKALRKDIGVQVDTNGESHDSTITFNVSYTGTDPTKVAKVAEALALFYIEENLKVREESSSGTTEFLRAQLRETQAKLEVQEQQVAQYKRQHLQELPEQLYGNMGMLSQLRTQVEATAAGLKAAEQRQSVVTERLASLKSRIAADRQTMTRLAALNGVTPTINGTAKDSASVPMTPAMQLATLKDQLAQMLVRFSDKHPEVIRTRKEIAALEQRIGTLEAEDPVIPVAAVDGQPEAETSVLKPVASAVTDLDRAQWQIELANLQREQSTLEADIVHKSTELSSLRKELAAYQQRVENTPAHEQELQALTRDYQATHELYLSLLKQLDESLLAGNLEDSRKAERFQIIEHAVAPQSPVGPRRKVLFVAALLIALGVTTVGVVLRDFMRPVFHSVEELRAFTTVEILGSVPRIVTADEQTKRFYRSGLGALTLVLVLFLLATASRNLVAENQGLAKLLSRSGAGVEVR
ncbi:MAG: GNVR domain-containing protein [Candidatus Binatia bacterium]